MYLQAVRGLAFPENKSTYVGSVGYRILLDYDTVKDIPDLPNINAFWHGPSGHLYTTQVGDNKFEISTRAIIPEKGHVSWGQDVSKQEVVDYYKVRSPDFRVLRRSLTIPIYQDFHPVLRALLDASPEHGWKQFAYFAAPRLETVVKGPVALIGDASHPLAGAFGEPTSFYIVFLSL